MNDVTIPNFGELLAEHIGRVSDAGRPYMLSQLERTAAARYRGWAEDVPAHREGLLACAQREDEIADRVEALLPPSATDRDLVHQLIPAAKATYYQVFEGLTPVQQMTIQAKAERQGAGAWQSMKAAYPNLSDEMDALSSIELQSADYLDGLLEALRHQ